MKKLLTYIFISLILLSNLSYVFAENLKSTNYQINGAVLDGGGQPKTSNTGNFNLLDTINDFSGDPRISSSNYSAKVGSVEIFTANTPKISCFETTTNGSSDCTTGPSYLNTNGMVTVCGPYGCYDRARFEIDEQKNPADTLYTVQISEDNFVSDIRYIDGITKKPNILSNLTIADFLTKSQWESSATNILGLNPDTQYYIRAIALHGDFTQGTPGPSATTTTAQATTFFDIDIADSSGSSAESADPYNINFDNNSKIIQTGPTVTSEQLIWLDAQTNAQGGLAVLMKDTNAGLHSNSMSYTISSVNNDLDGIPEGFGFQNFSSASQYTVLGGQGTLSLLTPESNYTGTGNQVGFVDVYFNKVYEANGPLYGGRAALLLKARASASAGEATDYSDVITIVVVPRY